MGNPFGGDLKMKKKRVRAPRRSTKGTTLSESLMRPSNLGTTRSTPPPALQRGFASRVFGARGAFDIPARKAGLVTSLALHLETARGPAREDSFAEAVVSLRKSDRVG